MKHCYKCKRDLEETDFYSGSNRYCKECTKNYRNQHRRNQKQEAVDYKGGKCSICGYSRSLRALEFHHLDPSKKDFGISKDNSFIPLYKIRDELDKCILVCANCHAEIHDGLIAQIG